MAEETLSQAAIDALLSGNSDSSESAPPPPLPSAPEPVAVPEPEPVSEPEPVVVVPEPVSEPVVIPEPIPEPVEVPEPKAEPVVSIFQPEQTSSPAVSAASVSVSPESLVELKNRVQKLEETLSQLETIVISNQQAGTSPELLNRLEAVESSVLTICSLQQDSEDGVAIAKIPLLEKKLTTKLPQLEMELENAKSEIADLSGKLQKALHQVQENSDQVKTTEKGLQGTWGYDIKRHYECESCGSRGHVVGLVKCSECGDEDWWGWWPSESGDD